jgi:hypothetical protein
LELRINDIEILNKRTQANLKTKYELMLANNKEQPVLRQSTSSIKDSPLRKKPIQWSNTKKQ